MPRRYEILLLQGGTRERRAIAQMEILQRGNMALRNANSSVLLQRDANGFGYTKTHRTYSPTSYVPPFSTSLSRYNDCACIISDSITLLYIRKFASVLYFTFIRFYDFDLYFLGKFIPLGINLFRTSNCDFRDIATPHFFVVRIENSRVPFDRSTTKGASRPPAGGQSNMLDRPKVPRSNLHRAAALLTQSIRETAAGSLLVIMELHARMANVTNYRDRPTCSFSLSFISLSLSLSIAC